MLNDIGSGAGMNFAKFLCRIRGAGALTDPEVANALRLSDTQVVRIRDVQRKNQATLRDRIRGLLGRSGKRESLRNSLRELQSEAQGQALLMLSDEQKQKLAQLQGRERT
jgi:hypothetical protein